MIYQHLVIVAIREGYLIILLLLHRKHLKQ